MKKLTLALSLLFFSAQVAADKFWLEPDYRKHDDIQVRFGLQRGGDTVGTFYEQETGETSEEIRAGGWYNYSLGYLWHSPSPFSVQLNYGFQRDGGRGEGNVLIATHAHPIELVPFYYLERHRFGLGVSYHNNPQFEFKLPNFDYEEKIYLDDAFTWLVQYDYSYTNNLTFGVKYNKAEYEVDHVKPGSEQQLTPWQAGDKIDASSFGVHVIYSF